MDINDYFYAWKPMLFRVKTRGMTTLQKGIYRELIDEYMITRLPLPSDDLALADIARVSIDVWNENKAPILAKFEIVNGELFHEHCNEELDFQDKNSRTKSKSGKKAAAKRWEHKQKPIMRKSCGSDAEAMRPACEPDAEGMRIDATGQDRTLQESLSLTLSPDEPELELPEPPTRKTPSAELSAFDDVLRAYPKGTGSGLARSVYSSLILTGKATHQQLLDAASVAGELYEDRDSRYIPGLAKYLREDWDSREVQALIERRKGSASTPEGEGTRMWQARIRAWLFPMLTWNNDWGPQPHEAGTQVNPGVLAQYQQKITEQAKRMEDGFDKIKLS